MNTHAPGTALRRRDAILKLVRSGPVRSQEELSTLLHERGFEVAQPTLSRDLKELGLAKTSAGYVLPGAVAEPVPGNGRGEERLVRALHEFVVSVETAGSLVVLRTPPAGAHPVAHAIDAAALDGVAGTIAGEDTVFVAARSNARAARVARTLSAALGPERFRPRRPRA